MPSIQLHSPGNGRSSPIPGASPLEAQQKAAGEAAAKSSVPWSNPAFAKANQAFAKMIEAETSKGQANAKASMSAVWRGLTPRSST